MSTKWKRISWREARTNYRQNKDVFCETSEGIVKMKDYPSWRRASHAFVFEAERIAKDSGDKKLKYYILEQ